MATSSIIRKLRAAEQRWKVAANPVFRTKRRKPRVEVEREELPRELVEAKRNWRDGAE